MDDEFDVNCNYLHPSLNPIESPFNQLLNPVVDHFLNNKDNKPEDGWELLFRGFGFDDEGEPISGDNNPFIVLYNKFLGILRVFTIVANNNTDYRYANVKIGFIANGTDNATSLFDFTFSDSTKPLRSLSEFPATGVGYGNYLLNNIVRFENNSKWFYADFALTYDPCTCLNKSKIWIDVCLISEADINIVGILDGVLASISQGHSTNSSSKIDKAESSITVTKIGKNIVETHKNFNKFNTDLSKYIDEFYINDSAKKDSTKESLNLLGEILGDGIVSEVVKAIPFIEYAFRFVDLFVGGGKSSSPQTVQLMPTSIKAKIALTGTITSTNPFQSIIFWNPGSNFTSSPFDDRQYPIYDQVLGTFNILKAPKVSINRSSNSTCVGEPYMLNDDEFKNYYTIYDTISMNLVEPLQYVLNPVAFSTNPEDVEILASIEFDFEFETNWPPYYKLQTKEVQEAGLVHVRDNTYRTKYYPVQCLTDKYFKFVIKHEVRDLSYFPAPDSCDNFPTHTLTFKNMKIQLLNLYKRNDLDEYPDADDILEIRTYGVSDIVVTNNVNDNDDYSISGFLNSLVLQDTTIASDITVWGDIEIGENVTLVGSTTYEITSIHGSITVKAGAVLSPNLILKVGYQSSCITPMYAPVSQNDVLTFCQSNQVGNYRPVDRNLKVRVDTEELQSSERTNNFHNSLDIFPNPTASLINLKFNIPESGSLKLVIHNMFGETVQVPTNNENHPAGGFSIPVDVSNLIPGVYYCTMYSPQGIITKSFMVMR
jgi:hypothetical protein